jgi:hypothetical protein
MFCAEVMHFFTELNRLLVLSKHKVAPTGSYRPDLRSSGENALAHPEHLGECLGKMTQAGIADGHGRFGDV